MLSDNGGAHNFRSTFWPPPPGGDRTYVPAYVPAYVPWTLTHLSQSQASAWVAISDNR